MLNLSIYQVYITFKTAIIALKFDSISIYHAPVSSSFYSNNLTRQYLSYQY